MKKIEAIIRPFKLEEVMGLLTAMGINGATITEVKLQGKQQGYRDADRGPAYSLDFYPMIQLEVVVTDEQKPKAIAAILRVTKTGNPGDGKIFISPLDEAIRISTDEHDAEAV